MQIYNYLYEKRTLLIILLTHHVSDLSIWRPRRTWRRAAATCTWRSWPRPPWPSAQPRSPSRSNSGTGDVYYITHSSGSDALMEESDGCKDSECGDTIWEWWHNARPGAQWSPHLRPSLTSGHLISIFIFVCSSINTKNTLKTYLKVDRSPRSLK